MLKRSCVSIIGVRSIALVVSRICGHNANTEQQGYRPATREKPQAIRSTHNAPGRMTPFFALFFLRLTCSTRLQEARFSQRRPIFADGQVYFHCRRAIWREDFAAEEISMRCNLGEFVNTFATNDPNMHPTMQYAKMVRQYS